MQTLDAVPSAGSHGTTKPTTKYPNEHPVSCSINVTIRQVYRLTQTERSIWAMYNGNRYLLCFLFLYLAAQTAAGLWQYTVPGGTPAPDPLDNYQYHCECITMIVSILILRRIQVCVYLPPKSMYVFIILPILYSDNANLK